MSCENSLNDVNSLNLKKLGNGRRDRKRENIHTILISKIFSKNLNEYIELSHTYFMFQVILIIYKISLLY